ncbi:MAG TPA: RidA family protein [Methylomirabilota bacterium]|jgi:enamine deaminase RidA (YjgF/YER057c/UK114 family)|nr:RidA family protein [Methylomirabilota bacterium]
MNTLGPADPSRSAPPRRDAGGLVRAGVDTGTAWEALAGYARAVRVGNRILVSGTTATGPDGAVAPGDAAAQARFILDKIQQAIETLGGRLRDVVRTRVYVRRLDDWEGVARVHGERFGDIRPANTLVQAGLVGDPYLVEIEAEAVIGAGDALQSPAE